MTVDGWNINVEERTKDRVVYAEHGSGSSMQLAVLVISKAGSRLMVANHAWLPLGVLGAMLVAGYEPDTSSER